MMPQPAIHNILSDDQQRRILARYGSGRRNRARHMSGQRASCRAASTATSCITHLTRSSSSPVAAPI
jgi:hypothetical protein